MFLFELPKGGNLARGRNVTKCTMSTEFPRIKWSSVVPHRLLLSLWFLSASRLRLPSLFFLLLFISHLSSSISFTSLFRFFFDSLTFHNDAASRVAFIGDVVAYDEDH